MLEKQYKKFIAARGRIAGPAVEALLASRIDQDTLDWLKISFGQQLIQEATERGGPAKPSATPRSPAASAYS